MNAFSERFIRSIKTECLNTMIFVGERSLRRAISEFVAHYHEERHHQGIGNELIQPRTLTSAGEVVVHERFGGLLKHYLREAA